MSHQKPPVESGRGEQPHPDIRRLPHRRGPLTPIRTLTAVAPSGGAIEFHKYSDSDGELSYWFGILTAIEHNLAWKASRMAAHGDSSYWDAAESILKRSGWTVDDHHAG